MKLSVLMPSHRSGLTAYARIIDACTWASDNVEVIVRDNSGCARKRALLSQIEAPHCRIIFAEECAMFENEAAVLAASSGEFVLYCADDDYCSKRAIDAVVAALEQHDGDHSIVGVAGLYIHENGSGSRIVKYDNIDAADGLARLRGYTDAQCADIYWSVRRRTTALWLVDVMRTLPITAPYADQLIMILALLAGRFLDINRLFYIYDAADWEGPRSAAKDASLYALCGINDPAILLIHWLFCAFEGAKLILSDIAPSTMTPTDRLAAAIGWYRLNIARLRAVLPHAPQSQLDFVAMKIRTKWLESNNVDMDALLDDLARFLALTCDDPARVERYRAFWSRLRPATS